MASLRVKKAYMHAPPSRTWIRLGGCFWILSLWVGVLYCLDRVRQFSILLQSASLWASLILLILCVLLSFVAFELSERYSYLSSHRNTLPCSCSYQAHLLLASLPKVSFFIHAHIEHTSCLLLSFRRKRFLIVLLPNYHRWFLLPCRNSSHLFAL